jgi:hypothetical protein
MRLAHSARLTAVSLAAILAGACSDSATTGPSTGSGLTPTFATAVVTSGGNGVTAPVLTRTTPLASDIVVSAVITPGKPGSAAQSVKIDAAGLKVSFPWNAVRVPTTVKITAYAGDLVSYSFEPHGIQFDTTIKVQQELKGTTAYKNDALRASLAGGYLDDGLADINADGIASITEVFPIYYNETDPTGTVKLTPSVAKFETRHFSGYIIATGLK